MQLTEQMLREAYQQTQREILADGGSTERYQNRWQRMAEVLNEKLEEEEQAKQQEDDTLNFQKKLFSDLEDAGANMIVLPEWMS